MASASELWEYTLQPADHGKKFEEILTRKFHFSRKLIQRIKIGERAWIDGKFTFLNVCGQAGQTLSLRLTDEEIFNFTPEDLPLDILFEDAYLLVVNKPAGIVVHPTPRYPAGTLGNAVLGYWARQKESRPFRPVHRIDRNTSGVVLIAKNQFANQHISWQLKHGHIQKNYLGLVEGQVQSDNGRIDHPIRLVSGSFIQRETHSEGDPALTYYRVISSLKQATLLEFDLKTGRTHQIRVHCQSIGHPLLGDDLYGGNTEYIQRQALHSHRYTLLHPFTNQAITLTAPLPQDFTALIEKLQL